MARAKKVEQKPVEKTRKVVDSYFDVIVKPIVTEKSMKLTQEQNKITVAVKPSASKDEIKDAFEAVFGVKVSKVNTVNVRAKEKKVGRYAGFKSAYKKAIVQLAEGQSLDLYKDVTK